jgi:1,4-alpha-glucan branching enzyme
MLKSLLTQKFHEGHCLEAYKLFGAHFEYHKAPGVRFRVYAPNAVQVQVIGSFNDWREGVDLHRDAQGAWSVFLTDVQEWTLYKYRIQHADGTWVEKSDPYAYASELRPNSASLVCNLEHYSWNDAIWVQRRDKHFNRPLNIYEVHLGSWMKRNAHEWMTYEELAHQLVPYVKRLGYTHVELMPLNEYPFDGSWGYQAHGYFSVTARYGTPKQFMYLVDQLHQNEIGVIMDFVPVHFVKDDFGLRRFDGTTLYEYPNDTDANSQWDTLNFDLWKEEVRSFLMSAANFWIETYHIDGLRIDAVSNIIFWHGNKNLGTNDGATAFIRRMNYYLNVRHPGLLMIAEDSSDFPMVTHPTTQMGLGFDYKWDLGWMNDTLNYYAKDPIYRSFDHHKLTFSMAYFYSENFILPLSHDEVVHGKGTIVNKMWGDYDQKFAQARNLFAYMMAHPGKKLNFMGNELAHFREWDEAVETDWFLLGYDKHAMFARFIQDLNQIYRHHSCLSLYDYSQEGFRWIDADNATQSIYSFYREDPRSVIVVVLNMTPLTYESFQLGVPFAGRYIELTNSEKDIYGGSNVCNYDPLDTQDAPHHGCAQSINIRIAPFAAIYFEHIKP